MKITFVTALFILSSILCLKAQKQDHPLISRYTGAEIEYYYQKDYDEVKFVKDYNNEKVTWVEAAGKHTSIVYEGPKKRSPLEIMRNFKDAIRSSGAKVIYTCSGKACDNGKPSYDMKFFDKVYYTEGNRSASNNHYVGFQLGSEQQQYLYAQLEENGTMYHIEVAVIDATSSGSLTLVEVVEEKLMDNNMVQVDANTIKKKMDKDGKIALYGILFDTGKATLKSQSLETIEQVAKYLQQNPSVNIYIVGHTDDTGSFDGNQRLSEQRAAAVKTALGKYGNLSSRVKTIGVGPVAPVASNDNEAGRTKNRRVEIVKRLK